jgi:predicted N-acetyltransferase YhbS
MTDIVSRPESEVPTAGPRSPVVLRTMTSEDIASGLRLCRASRWNQVARDWELFLAMNPEGCRVAVDAAGDVVGSVTTIDYGGAFGWIAMLLVDPSRRGEGIGTRLLEEGLRLLARLPIVRLDATPAGYGVYLRGGFLEEYRLQRMQRDAQPPGAPTAGATADSRTRPMLARDFEEVAALDEQAFGANRRALIDVFRRGAPEYAWVAGASALDGYIVGRHGHTFEHLGPLVARDEETARRLLVRCVTDLPGRPVILDAPPHASWAGWLESLGFTVQRPFIRMSLGEQRHRERLDRMFAIAGAEFA